MTSLIIFLLSFALGISLRLNLMRKNTIRTLKTKMELSKTLLELTQEALAARQKMCHIQKEIIEKQDLLHTKTDGSDFHKINLN